MSDANPRVLAQDFLATLVVWDAALTGTLQRRELFAARELFTTFDPPARRDDVQRGLMDFAKRRAVTLPMENVDADHVRRVFSALPFGPIDGPAPQLLFVLWLWHHFARERAVVRAAIVATRGVLLAEVKRLTELSRPLAEKVAPVGAELLSVDVALERFLQFLDPSKTPAPADWGWRLALGLATAAVPRENVEVTPAELVAAVWCSYRIDGSSFSALLSRSA